MLHPKSLVSLITFLLWTSSFQASAQDIDQFNEISIDSTLIKKFGIKSLTVYGDAAENGLEKSSYSITNKWKEIAFNAEGQIIYRISYPLFSDYGIPHPNSIHWEWFKHDQLQRVIYSKTKEGEFEVEQSHEYNSENRIVKTEVTIDGEPNNTKTYEWEDGQLIKSELKEADTSDSKFNCVWNMHGDIVSTHYISLESDHSTRTEFTYSRNEHILDKKMLFFVNNKLASSNFVRINERSKKTLYLVNLDEKSDTLLEIQARYDSLDNIIFFHSKDFSSRRYREVNPEDPSENSIPPPYQAIFEIENIYDDRGLLTKRKYVAVDAEDPSKKKLISIQRFIYETDELLIQPLPVEEEPIYDYGGGY